MQSSRDNQTANTLPIVGIIILNWNGWEDTFACLRSLEALDYPAARVIVIDNGSSETPEDDPKECFPGVEFLYLPENSGFAGGNNTGIWQARELGVDYVLLLNNDTEVAPDFLRLLVEASESDPHIGMAGPTIYYYSLPDVIWSAGGEVDRLRGDTRTIGVDEIERGQYGQTPRAVDWITGCALLVRMSVIERVGALDERFFAYYEEAEWCARARQAGYLVMHVPRAKVWHKISQQSREASPVVSYYMARNRLLYLKLTGMGMIPWIFTYGELGRRLASWTLRPKWRGKARQREAVVRALRDFTQNRFGKAETPAERQAPA